MASQQIYNTRACSWVMTASVLAFNKFDTDTDTYLTLASIFRFEEDSVLILELVFMAVVDRFTIAILTEF